MICLTQSLANKKLIKLNVIKSFTFVVLTCSKNRSIHTEILENIGMSVYLRKMLIYSYECKHMYI